MTRLIDADALEKEMCSGCEHNKNKYANCDDCAIANAPTIDAEPVKHGEWKYCHYKDINDVYVGVCECTVCKQREYSEHKYCPNCGAKMDNMRGEEE